MSSSAVATIACLALVAAAAAVGWVVVQHRRTDALARSRTARKWDIVTLRAELGAIRRQMQDPTTADGAVPADDRPAPVPEPADDAGPGGEPGPDLVGRGGELGAGNGTVPPARSPAGPSPSPTAWRRDRARAASSRPRRRRPF